MGMNRAIKSTTAWIIVSACVVILFGGALTWYNIKYPTDDAIDTSITAPATTNTTKDWKTYSNTDYGFSFKYPKNWVAGMLMSRDLLFASNQSDLDVLTGKSKAEMSHNGARLEVFIDDLKDYADEKTALNSIPGRKTSTFSFTDIKAGDADATKAVRIVKKGESFAESPSTAAVDTKEIIYNVINGTHLIRYWFTLEGNGYRPELINQIFQTSAMTSVNAESGLKTYTSSASDYHFSYPEGWTLDASYPGTVIFRSPETQAIIAEMSKKNVATEGPPADLSITYYETLAVSDSNNPKKYQTMEQKMNDPMYYVSPSKITFAGVPAFEAISTGMFSSYSVTVEKNGHIYELVFNKESKGELTAIQKDIISSFSFTK